MEPFLQRSRSVRRCTSIRIRVALAALTSTGLLGGAHALPFQSQGIGPVPTLSTTGVRNATGEGLAFVDVLAPKSVRAGSSLRLTVRVGLERVFHDERLQQLFRRTLELPIQLQADWLRDAVVVENPNSDAGAQKRSEGALLAVMGRVLAAREVASEERQGEVYRMWSLSFDVPRTDVLSDDAYELAPVLLRFAYATRFREDLIAGRIAVDHHDAYVLSAPARIEVVPLPEVPVDFSGLVGDVRVTTRLSAQEVVVGEPIELLVELRSDQDLGALKAPRLDGRGWATRGVTREPVPGGLDLRYELLATALPRGAGATGATRALPDVSFVVFDPDADTYRAARAAALEVHVLPASAAESSATSEQGEDTAEIDGRWGPVLTIVGGLLLICGVLLATRSGRSTREGEGAARKRALRAELDRINSEDNLAERFPQALERLLAHVVDLPASAPLEQRLQQAGCPPELASRLLAASAALESTRFGGASAEDAPSSAVLVELVGELVGELS